MNFKFLSSVTSLLLIIILTPFLSVLGTIDLLHSHHGHGHDGHHHPHKTSAERLANLNKEQQKELIKEKQKKENTNALRASWYELLNASELTKKQDIRVFRIPTEDDITGLTVLWGTWFQFTDVNGDIWNVNAPFSYSQYDRAGNFDGLPDTFTDRNPSTEERKTEIKRLRQVEEGKNTKRLAENIFNDVSLFKAKVAGQKRELTEVKQTALKDLFTFNDFPVLDKAEENTLRYVANFASEEYLTNPAGHVHYQKLISTPKKTAGSEKKFNNPKDLPYLAGYEANELFFNWHPKLRGVQLINTKNPAPNGFYQFALVWNGWGATNKLKDKKGTTYNISPANLPLLRARLVIHQLTKNINPADEITEEANDQNRLAWLLRDHHDYADHEDHEEEDEGGERHEEPEEDDEHHEDHEGETITKKPADIFAIIFKNGENDETFRDWVLTQKEINDTKKVVAEIKKLTKQNQTLEQIETILSKTNKLIDKMDKEQKQRLKKSLGHILESLGPGIMMEKIKGFVLVLSDQDKRDVEGGWTIKLLDNNEAETTDTVTPVNKSPIKVLDDGLNNYLNLFKPPEGYDGDEDSQSLFWEVQPEQRKKVKKMVAEIKKLIAEDVDRESMQTIIKTMSKIMKKVGDESEQKKFKNIMANILREWAPEPSWLTGTEVTDKDNNPMGEIDKYWKDWKISFQSKINKANTLQNSISRMFNTVHVLKFKHLFEIKKPALPIFLASAGIATAGAGAFGSYLFLFDKRHLAKGVKLKKLATGAGSIFGVVGILGIAVFVIFSANQPELIDKHNNTQNHVGHDHSHHHHH